MGESFTRDAFYNGQVEQTVLSQEAKVWTEQAPHPSTDRQAAVALEVRYDGRPVPPQLREGKAFLPEPREGQVVELFLRRANGWPWW